LADAFQRTREEPDPGSDARSCDCSLGAGVPGTNHDHIEIIFTRSRVSHDGKGDCP
jgi:hypothetical protein